MKTILKELIMNNIAKVGRGIRALKSHLQGLPLQALLNGVKQRLPEYQNLKSQISRRKVALFGISIFAIGILINVFTSKSVEAGWWDETWLYRIKETFTNSASAIANYQVSITLDTATLITAGKMQADCDDVRLTDIGGKELTYWIEESGVGGCNSATTKIWTKLPMLYAGKTDIYLYYGNSQTASGANGNEVFEQFDTFSGTTLDGTKWSSSGTPEITSGSLKLESGDSVVSNATKTDANGLGQIIYRAKQAITNLTAGKIGFSNTSNLSTHYQTDDAVVNQIGSTEETVSSIGSTNLVSHYQLEETTSTDANQFKASGYFDTGKLNQAVSMYGNSAGNQGSTLTFNRGAQISGYNYEHVNSNQGTISFWFKPSWSGNPTVTKTLYRNTYGTPGNIYVGVTGTLTYYYWNGSTQFTASIAGTSWSSSTWYHVVARWNIDAAVSGSQRIAVTLNTADSSNGYTSDFTTQVPGPVNVIGSLEDGSQASNALIDDFAIYDRVLTTTEIASLYNSGSGNEAGYVADSSLKFYAKLDGSGTLQPVTYNAGVNVDQKAYNVSTNTNGNMVTDWDMETAGTANWTADGTYVASGAILTKITSGVFADTQSLQIDINNTNQGVRALVSASVNSNYALSFWCKGGQTIFPRIRSLPDNVAIISTNTDCSANWGKKDYVFKTTASTTQLAVEFADSGTLTFYLDNVTLTPSLVDNGGMEGTYTGSGTLFYAPSPVQWVNTNMDDGSDIATDEVTIVHSGSKSQKIQVDASVEGFYQGINPTGFVVGNYYLVSSWVYLSSGSVAMLGQNRWSFATSTVTTTGAWMKLSIITQYTGTSGGWANVIFRSINGAATFYVDDVSVIPLDNVATSLKAWTPVQDSPGVNSTELLTNVDFETAGTWNIDGTPATSQRETTKPHNDAYSWHVVTDESYEGLNQTITAVIGKQYKISAWVYLVSGVAHIKDNNNNTYLNDTTVGQWVNVIFYDVPSVSNIPLRILGATPGNEFFVDDVSIKEVPNPLSVQGNPASGVTSTTSGARGNAYTFDGSTGYLRQKTYDVNVGTITYQDSNTDISDDGQEFEDWDNDNAGSAEYMIVVTNSDNTTSWGYFCANDGGTQTAVYTLKACTGGSEGFNGTSPSGKTPVGYEVRKTDYQITGDLTIGTWIKRSAIGYADSVVAKFGSSSAISSYLLRLETNNTIMLNTNNSAAIYSDTTITSTSDWYFIVATLSGTTGNIYINGVLDKTGTINNPRNDGPSAITVGAASACNTTGIPCWYFHGSIDSPFVLPTTLTTDQIKDIYNSTASHYGLVSNNLTVGTGISASSARNDSNNYATYTLISGSTSSFLTQDGTTIATSTSNLPNSAMYIRAQNSSASSIYIDWIASTKQLATQPSAVAATEEKSPAPVGYWKLDEGTGSDVKDSSGSGLTGTITGASWQTEDMCVSSKCLIFDGTNDYVNLAQNSNYAYQNGDTWTVGVWFKTTASITGTNGGKVIVAKGTGNAIPGYALAIGQLNSQGYDNKLGFVIDKSPGNNLVISASSLPTINDNNWHYASVVFDAANNTNITGTIYLDGKSYGTQTSAVARSGWASTTSYPMRVGTAGIANSEFFPGFVDEVKIYPYARTAAQIKADYNSRGTVAAAAVVIGAQQSEALSEGLVGYWKMDESSGTLTDSSGNGNTGTWNGTGGSHYTTGKYGNGGGFNGTDDYVNAGTGAAISQSFTLASWVNPAAGAVSRYIIDKSNDGNGYILGISNLVPFCVIGTGSYQTVIATNPLIASQWSQVSCTYDITSGQVYIFVNGSLVKSQIITGVIVSSSVRQVSIGSRGASTYFSGSLDDVRIYNRALSAAEVRALYDWSPNPVAYWKMDEGTGQSASDISGNGNTGTLGSSGGSDSADPTWTTGKYGKALQFDGADDYASTTYSILYDVTTRGTTYELWLNPKEIHTANMSGTDKYRVFMSSYNCTGNKGWNVGYDGTAGSGRLYVAINSTIIVNSTPQTLDIGNWYHIVYITYANSTGSKIYLNGNNVTNSGTSVSYVATDLSLNIGRQASNSCGGSSYRYTNGSIDDVRIYNYARSAKEIVEDMNAGHPAGGSPVGSAVAYYKFNEGQGITANNSGNGGSSLNGTLTNMASPATSTSGWTTNGKSDKALSFNGTNDYVEVADNSSLDITGEITLSYWTKVTSTQSINYGGVAKYANMTGYSNQRAYGCWFVLNTTQPNCTISDNGTADVNHFTGITSSNNIGTNIWAHIIFTYKPSTYLRLYVNGKLDTEVTTGVISSINNSTAPLWIGTNYDTTVTTRYLPGFIDEVKIYPYALTSDEVLIDYNRGQVAVMGSTGTSATGLADNSDARQYCPPGNVEGNCANGLNPAPVAEWNFEEGAGSTAKDTSGNANNGAITGATYKTGKIGSALSFVGASSNLVNIGDNASVDFTGSFTISTWLKTSTTGAIGAFVSKWGNSNGAKQYNLSINDDNTILFAVMHSGASFSWMLSNATVTDNNWHHVEAINDDTTNKLYIYIDGKLDNSVTRTSANSLQNTTTPLRLGEQGDGNGAYYTGLLDNVRLYNYTRTQAQVAYDYNRGAPIGWWKLNECQGTTANDSSGNNNVGTITIGATGTQTSAGTCSSGVSTEAWNNGTNGKFNASLNLDGVDDFITASNFSNSFNFNGPFAIAFWFKQDALTGDKTMISNWRMANIGGVTNHGMFIERTTIANKTLRFVYRNNGVGVFDFYIGNTYQANQWNHVLAVYDPSLPSANAKIYLNGILGDTTATANTTFSITGRSLLIGSLDGGADSYGRYFNGQIDDVRIYNYALTAEQIRMIYNGSSAVKF